MKVKMLRVSSYEEMMKLMLKVALLRKMGQIRGCSMKICNAFVGMSMREETFHIITFIIQYYVSKDSGGS